LQVALGAWQDGFNASVVCTDRHALPALCAAVLSTALTSTAFKSGQRLAVAGLLMYDCVLHDVLSEALPAHTGGKPCILAASGGQRCSTGSLQSKDPILVEVADADAAERVLHVLRRSAAAAATAGHAPVPFLHLQWLSNQSDTGAAGNSDNSDDEQGKSVAMARNSSLTLIDISGGRAMKEHHDDITKLVHKLLERQEDPAGEAD
jgi:hypothetical protein